MKKLLFVFLILSFSIKLYAQTAVMQWQNFFGGTGSDLATSMDQTSDGGFIIAGSSSSTNGDATGNNGSADIWIIKVNATGTLQWQKSFGGTAADRANSIKQTADGGYIIAGSTASNNVDVSGNHGLDDFWVVKLDVSGNLQWQKCLGGTNADVAYSVQQTEDRGYIVAGQSRSNDGDVSGNHGDGDYWIVKLDAAGNLNWQKCFGGTNEEFAKCVQQTDDGGYVIAGYTSSNNGDVSGHHGIPSSDFWVLKLDASGNLQWQKCLGGSVFDDANYIQQMSDGTYIVAGNTSSNNGDVSGNHGGNSDGWIVKINGGGSLVWQKCLGGTGEDRAEYIQPTIDGGYIVTGRSKSIHSNWSSWSVKIDGTGNQEWEKLMGGGDFAVSHAVKEIAEDEYVLIGRLLANSGGSGHHGDFDYWLVKLVENATLPAHFGTVNAQIHNNLISVNWTTLSEINIDHFEIEASADGNSFRKIGSINSEASNGNSSEHISYNFKTSIGERLAAMLFVGFLINGIMGLKRHIRPLWQYLLLSVIFLVMFIGCSQKGADWDLDINGKRTYVRVVSVDKDGSKNYSRIVIAIVR